MSFGGLQINALDLVHPDVSTIEEGLKSKSGQKILKYGGMCNGVGQMVTDITRLASPGQVAVLRIWSHGYPGGQGVSTGMPDARIKARGERAGIGLTNLPDLDPDLARLAPYFQPRGRMELRGCSVGGGFDGLKFLGDLAKALGVEVCAALNEQPIGPLEWAGPVLTVAPTGGQRTDSGPPIK